MSTRSYSVLLQKILICFFLGFSTISYAADELALSTIQIVPGTAADASGDNPQNYNVGDTVMLAITATNTGAGSANITAISDSLGSISACTPQPPAILAQGEQITCASSYVLNSNDIAAGAVTSIGTADYEYEGEFQTALASESIVLGYVANNDLPLQCGIDIVMVLDSSGSINGFQAIDDMAGAARSFANAFSNTGSRIAITSYAWKKTVVRNWLCLLSF